MCGAAHPSPGSLEIAHKTPPPPSHPHTHTHSLSDTPTKETKNRKKSHAYPCTSSLRMLNFFPRYMNSPHVSHCGGDLRCVCVGLVCGVVCGGDQSNDRGRRIHPPHHTPYTHPYQGQSRPGGSHPPHHHITHIPTRLFTWMLKGSIMRVSICLKGSHLVLGTRRGSKSGGKYLLRTLRSPIFLARCC